MPDKDAPSFTPEELLPAELLERYVDISLLGMGGMGMVLRARDRELRRDVAIKVIRARGHAILEERALREASFLAGIRHPNVVEVYDQGRGPRGPYLVLELVEGCPLDRLPESVDPLPPLLQIASALDAVHRAGRVHRDVKPQNVILCEDGRAVLLDFGLTHAPELDTLTRTGLLIGTPPFMAPECLRGEKGTPASDWYSWGASLYWLEERREPFDGIQIVNIARGAPRPRLHFRRLPPAGARAGLIERLLSAEPEERPVGQAMVLRLLEGEPLGTEGGTLGPSREGSAGARAETRARGGRRRAADGGPTRRADRIPDRPGRTTPLGVSLTLAVVIVLLAWRFVAVPAPPAAPGGEALLPEGALLEPRPPGDETSFPSPEWSARLHRELDAATLLFLDPEGATRRLEQGTPPEDWRPLLGPDPLLWPRQLAALPALDDFQDWLASGGTAEELSASERAVLGEIESKLAADGVADPFHPFLSMHPSDAPLSLRGLEWMLPPGVDPPPSVEGWLAGAMEAAEEARLFLAREQTRIRDHAELERLPVELLDFTSRVSLQTSRRLHVSLGAIFAAPRVRRGVVRWLRHGIDETRRMLATGVRSIREEEPSRELAALVLCRALDELGAFVFSEIAFVEPARVLGGPPRSPAEALVHAALAEHALDVRIRQRGEAPTRNLERLLVELAESASELSPRPSPLSRRRSDHALRMLVRELQRQRAWSRIRRVLRERQTLLGDDQASPELESLLEALERSLRREEAPAGGAERASSPADRSR